MIAIRGAITVKEDTKEEIYKATSDLLKSIIEKNSLNTDDIISIFFTCTRDLKSAYPAVAARSLGITNAGLMCFNEMYVEGSLTRCIRVLINANKVISQKEVKHIYMEGAVVLRPDLTSLN
ncbi:chorismate mutase AroH [Oxobacter pfennigii]|uniref:chorismate mutase n=1 Tax=Oxobacter pfennigii TaxID=36849 RepID=A0A0P8WA63_9CLOT|nr:chorismate mutase [Oxobacter pfennigii]KPU44858.1 chorismate mutase AroH [Oxobacter pfennigii]